MRDDIHEIPSVATNKILSLREIVSGGDVAKIRHLNASKNFGGGVLGGTLRGLAGASTPSSVLILWCFSHTLTSDASF